jgi:DNA-binding NarL/FixJ family response regulator
VAHRRRLAERRGHRAGPATRRSGKSNKEIGDELSISEATVKSYVNAILSKLEANDRTHAAMIALKRGLIR